MKSQSKVHRKGHVEQRYASITDEEIRLRWLAIRPKAVRALCICAAITLGTFLVLTFKYPTSTIGQRSLPFLGAEYIATLAFQVSSVFDLCLGLLAGLSFVYGRQTSKK